MKLPYGTFSGRSLSPERLEARCFRLWAAWDKIDTGVTAGKLPRLRLAFSSLTSSTRSRRKEATTRRASRTESLISFSRSSTESRASKASQAGYEQEFGLSSRDEPSPSPKNYLLSWPCPTRAGVVVLAASSRPDLLDAALLRPGRLDRLIYCGIPDSTHRLAILHALSRKLPLTADANLQHIASRTEHFTGADLGALLADAQLAAVHQVLDGGSSPTAHLAVRALDLFSLDWFLHADTRQICMQ